jgi:hypothetical protein
MSIMVLLGIVGALLGVGLIAFLIKKGGDRFFRSVDPDHCDDGGHNYEKKL